MGYFTVEQWNRRSLDAEAVREACAKLVDKRADAARKTVLVFGEQISPVDEVRPSEAHRMEKFLRITAGSIRSLDLSTINAATQDGPLQGHDLGAPSNDGNNPPAVAAPVPQPQDGVVRRVVCAAIRAADGALLLGIRHYSQDMHQQIALRHDGSKFKHRLDEDQGFVDQHGIYMSREEAFSVALAEGQKLNMEACSLGLDNEWKLYSEGLY